jgi:hypothetical protein
VFCRIGDTCNKFQKKKDSAEANLVERIALDLDELDLSDVSELVNNSGSEEEIKSKKSSVVEALASGAEVTPSEGGKVGFRRKLVFFRDRCRVARFFLVQHTKTGNIYQMAIK